MLQEGYSLKDVTPNANEDQIVKAPVFRYFMVDIRSGSEFSFIWDERRTATVHEDKEVNFENRVSSLNRVTLELLKELGLVRKTASSPNLWLYKGETLTDRNIRMNDEEDGD